MNLAYALTLPALVAPLAVSGAASAAETPKEVLAFYYSWYGTPEVSKRWVHWQDVEAAQKRIGNSTHYPAIGPYDSHDPKLLARHCRQAKEAGLTGFIMTWWRQRDFHLEGWKEALSRLRAKNVQVALIGDQISPQSAAVFDGIHTYNPTGKTKGMSAEQVRAWAKATFPGWVKTAGNKISCVTIIPGYDDTKLGRSGERPITKRHDGATYRAMWEQAIAANANWVLVTSWNEWHEGSEIEPSVEDGDQALKITAEYAPRFLKQTPRGRVENL